MQLAELIPGFRHSGQWNREGLSERLVDLWLQDTGAVTGIAALPWVRDGIAGWDNPLLRALVTITMADAGLGNRIAGFPWMSGSVSEAQWVWLTGLSRIASRDIELAGAVAAVPWFTDDGSGYAAVASLADIASKDLELARTIAALPWFTDGVTDGEDSTLFYLDRIASTDLGFAWAIAGAPWFTDSVSEGDWGKVQNLELVLSGNPELARWLSELSLAHSSNSSLLGQVYLTVANQPHVVSRITSQPWFEDGLDQEESAFLVALFGTVGDASLFDALLEGHYTQSKTVSLPLAGEVNIWVFQTAPFSSGEDTPTIIEDLVRGVEGFVGSPLPATDVVVLIEGLPPDTAYSTLASTGSQIRISTDYGQGIGHLRLSLIREIARYYRFNSPWLNESFTRFVEGQVGQRMGLRSMVEVRAEVSDGVQHSCSHEDIASIRHAILVDRFFRGTQTGQCTRALGLSFLHEASDLIGEEGVAAALGGLSLPDGPATEAAEEALFHALLSNTHPDRQEEFRGLYRRLHGGPYADPDVDRSDDHGDSEDAATVVAAGEAVVGTIDYTFDFDYFSFQAQESQKYRFEIDHETLRADNVVVLTSAGDRSSGVKARVRVPSGPLVQWIAPRSGVYYFAMLNLRGDTGQYTLRITHVPDVPDDHGDVPTAATGIAVGEAVHGVIDDDFDVDYFRFPVVAGQFYSVKITGAALQGCCVGWTLAGDTSEFGWWEVTTGERYIVVHGGHENTGAYVLEVTTE